MRRLIFVALLALVGACAPKTLPAPVVSTPRFPDFLEPAVPPSLAGTPGAPFHERGWLFLQAGDLKSAEREFSTALRLTPGLFPASDGLGYVELARNDPKASLAHFDRALERETRDLPALLGRGEALLALERESEALAAFEAALAVNASLPEVARRVEVLRFRGQQDELNRARNAARAGRFDEAAAIYNRAIARSRDSAFLYRELAGVERQTGDAEHAIEHLRKAVELEPGDARSLAQIGDLLEARGDVDGAEKAYADALAFEASADVEGKLERLRARADLARLPEEYRAIDRTPQITRGELAALVGVRLAGLLQSAGRRDAVLITDSRTHWASGWIVAVARAGVMDPFANHAFQPRTVVRRVDLAQVVNRLLARVAQQPPGRPRPWQSARLKFPDIGPGHLAYPAVSVAVASGVMTTDAGGAFQPSRPVTGEEATAAVDRIDALVRASAPKGRSGR